MKQLRILALLVFTLLSIISCGSSSDGDGGGAQAEKISLIELRVGSAIIKEGQTLDVTAILPRTSSELTTLVWEVISPKGRVSPESGAFTIDPGLRNGVFQIILPENDVYNASGAIKIQVRDQSGKLKNAEFSIGAEDNDPMPFVFVSDAEGVRGSRFDLEVGLSHASGEDTRVDWRTADVTATQGVDYIGASGSVLIPAGALKGLVSVTTFPTASDSTFLIQLLSADTANISDGSATGHIIVGDSLDASVSFRAAQDHITEADVTASVDVQLSNAIGRDVNITFKVSGSATAGKDLQPVTATAVIPAGQTRAAIPVTVMDDTLFENAEDVTFELLSSTFASFGAITRHSLVIDDNDPMPTISIFDVQTTEGSPLNFSVALDKVSGADTSFSYKTVAGKADSTDFAASAGTLTIARGTTVAKLSVTTINDLLFETREKMTVLLTEAEGATLLKASGDGTIMDDDKMPIAQFAIATQTVPASQKEVHVDVTLNETSGTSVSIPVAVAGSAQPGIDHNMAPSVITLPAGTKKYKIKFSLFTHGVGKDIILQLGTPQNADLGSTSVHTVTF